MGGQSSHLENENFYISHKVMVIRFCSFKLYCCKPFYLIFYLFYIRNFDSMKFSIGYQYIDIYKKLKCLFLVVWSIIEEAHFYQ